MPLSDFRIQGDLTYSDAHPRCKLDFYLPENPTGKLIVWFHGGGLTMGDKAGECAHAPVLASRGIAVAMANYRYSEGSEQFPSYVKDAAAAVAWSAANIDLHPTTEIYVGGMSAGAYLAALLSLDPHYLEQAGFEPSRLAGLAALSGQLSTHFRVKEERGCPGPQIVSDAASPLFHLRPGLLPMLLLVGDDDMPARLEEYQLFYKSALLAGNNRIRFDVIRNRTHQTFFEAASDPNDPVIKALLEFLGSV